MRSWPRRMAMALVSLMIATPLSQVASAQADLAAEVTQPTLTAGIDRSVDDFAAELLWDADAIREWVAESISPDGYQGILKGARGALLTGSANAADQALLLGALLDEALISYRYASCDVSGRRTAATEQVRSYPELGVDNANQIAAEVDDPELKEAIVRVAELRQRLKQETEEAAQELAVDLARIPIPAPVESDVAKATTRHVWVQMAFGAEWKDLDTTTPTGIPPCEVGEVHRSLPQEMEHRIRIAVEVEQRNGERLQTSEALVIDVPSMDLAASRVAFTFGEPAGLIERGSPVETSLGGSSVKELMPYTPVVVIDGRVTVGRPIVVPPPSGALLNLGDMIEEIGEDLFGEDGGLFDEGEGLSGEEEDGSAIDEPNPFTSAWLRIDLISPDGRTLTLRSEIFDRIGIAARAEASTASATVMPLQEVQGEYAELGALWQVGLLFGEMHLPELAFDASLDVGTVSGLSGHLDGLLRTFPAIYRDLGGSPDGPMVLLAGLTEATAADGTPVTRLVLDALHAPGSPPTSRLAAARDAQALVGAEALLTSILELDEGDASETSAALAAARSASIPLVVLAPGDTAPSEGISARAHARITQRLADGYWLLTPSSPATTDGTTAWWFVDPSTGAVRDELENGRHQDLTEESITTGQALKSAERHRRFACKWARPVILAASLLFAVAGSDPAAGSLLKAVAKTAQAAEEQRRRGKEALKVACAGTGASGAPR